MVAVLCHLVAFQSPSCSWQGPLQVLLSKPRSRSRAGQSSLDLLWACGFPSLNSSPQATHGENSSQNSVFFVSSPLDSFTVLLFVCIFLICTSGCWFKIRKSFFFSICSFLLAGTYLDNLMNSSVLVAIKCMILSLRNTTNKQTEKKPISSFWWPIKIFHRKQLWQHRK